MRTSWLPKSFRQDVAIIGTLMFVSSTIFAQAPPATGGAPGGAPAAGGTAEAERVIVTGSNIPTAEEVGPNPVTNLNRDYIQKTGTVSVEQLLKDQPVNNSNSIPVAGNGTSQGGPVGFTSVALRALDPEPAWSCWTGAVLRACSVAPSSISTPSHWRRLRASKF